MKTKNLILTHHCSPGDVVVMTAAIRDLHACYPGRFVTDVRTSADAIFENNPHITKLKDGKNIRMDYGGQYLYDGIDCCNEGAYHFVHGFAGDLNRQLNINMQIRHLKGDIHISDQEKSWHSQIYEILGKDVPYWIIDAGYKSDFTAKWWGLSRFQKVVDLLPEITFVQVGAAEHLHSKLTGDNVISLLGKTDLRQLIRLVYHSYGVITPVSLPMHLAAAIEMKSVFKRKTRPCVVIAGGREPSHWEAYCNHMYLHSCGKLFCCDNGGCWANRTVKLNDGDGKDGHCCLYPVTRHLPVAGTTENATIETRVESVPKCLDLITAEEVAKHVKEYLLWEEPPRNEPKQEPKYELQELPKEEPKEPESPKEESPEELPKTINVSPEAKEAILSGKFQPLQPPTSLDTMMAEVTTPKEEPPKEDEAPK